MDEFSVSDENNITMLRNYNFVGGGVHFWPLVNGQEISGIYPKEHVAFKLNSGNYSLGVRCYDSVFPMQYTEEIEVSILGNESRFFLLSSKIVFGCAEIEEIEEHEALDRLSDSTRIITGKVSDCEGNSLSYEGYEHELCFSNALP